MPESYYTILIFANEHCVGLDDHRVIHSCCDLAERHGTSDPDQSFHNICDIYIICFSFVLRQYVAYYNMCCTCFNQVNTQQTWVQVVF